MLPYSAYANPLIRKILKNTPYWEDLKSKESIDRFIVNSMDRQSKGDIFSIMIKVDEFHDRLNVHSILYWDDRYPAMLREIHDPPLVLFVQGNPDILNCNLWGVVGTRKASPLSLRATQGLVENYIPKERGVVSGLALGIDREAMISSLKMKRPTVGVLGTSIEKEYPYTNRDLYNLMKSYKNSILVSEYLPDTVYSKWTFPRRNRIITGMSEKIFLMETPIKSGAMSSAHSAIQQNREVHVFDHKYLYDNNGGRSLIENGAEFLQWEDVMPSTYICHGVRDRNSLLKLTSSNLLVNETSSISEWQFRGFLKQMEANQRITFLGDDLYCIL